MTDVIEIGKEQAIALLERAVAEKGEDFVYTAIRFEGMGEKCVYADPNSNAPSCIVGHALAYVGVPVENLGKLDRLGHIGAIYELNAVSADGYTGADPDHGIPSALEEITGVHLTDEAEAVFTEAQSNQDTGFTWGRSVGLAKDKLELSPEDFYRMKYKLD